VLVCNRRKDRLKFQFFEEGIRMSNQQNNKRSLGAILALGALVLSSSAFAADALGMKVVRDAETGQLRGPTPVEAQLMQTQQNQVKGTNKSKGMLTGTTTPQQVVTKRGAVMMELTEDSMVYSVAKVNADGKLEMQCVTGSDAASKFVNNKSLPASSHSEHKHDK
jgi:hypothetical protein